MCFTAHMFIACLSQKHGYPSKTGSTTAPRMLGYGETNKKGGDGLHQTPQNEAVTMEEAALGIGMAAAGARITEIRATVAERTPTTSAGTTMVRLAAIARTAGHVEGEIMPINSNKGRIINGKGQGTT